MTQSGITNAIVNGLLGWLRGLASWVLRLFDLVGGASPLEKSCRMSCTGWRTRHTDTTAMAAPKISAAAAVNRLKYRLFVIWPTTVFLGSCLR